MGSLRRGLWVGLALWLASCTVEGPPTGVVVVVRAEPGLEQALDRLQLVVRGGKGDPSGWEQMHEGTLPIDRWPLTFLLTPREGDSGRGYEVLLSGFEGTRELVRTRARSGWISGRTLTLELWLLDECEGVLCAAGLTCEPDAGGTCADAQRAAQDLPAYLGDVPETDLQTADAPDVDLGSGDVAEAGQEPDAPGDASTDPTSEPDAATPTEPDAGALPGAGADASPDAGVGDCERFAWYADVDGDGQGDLLDVVEACAQPDGYVDQGDDPEPDCPTNDTDRCGVCGGDDSTCNACLDNGGSHLCDAVATSCGSGIEIDCSLDEMGCRVETETECEFDCGVRGCCDVDPETSCSPSGAPERCGITYVASCGIFRDCDTCSEGVCIDGSCCIAQCDGRDCGGDGCGGTCGDCASGQGCRVDGVCGAPVHALLAGGAAWSPDDLLPAAQHQVLRVGIQPGELPGRKIGVPLAYATPAAISDLDALCVRSDGTVGLSSAGAYGQRTDVQLWDPSSGALGHWFSLGENALDLEALHCEGGTVFVSGTFPGGASYQTGDILWFQPDSGDMGVAVDGADFWGEVKVVALSTSERGNFVVALDYSGELSDGTDYDRRTLIELEFGPFQFPQSGYRSYLASFDFHDPPSSGWEALHIEH